MRSLLLSPPDAHRWGLESVLRNAGYDVEFRDDPRLAGGVFLAERFDLVVIDEPADGAKYTGVFLNDVRDAPDDPPPILCLPPRPNVVGPTLGPDAARVHMVPAPLDSLILKMLFEDLGLPWAPTPGDRKVVEPPTPDRPWGKVGMKEGTVDAAGIPTEPPAPAAEEAAPEDAAGPEGGDAPEADAAAEPSPTDA